jgi:hypothetical protein
MVTRHTEKSHPSENDAKDQGHGMCLKDISLNDLLARFDPVKHTHGLLLDGEPMGQETI